MTDWVKRRLGDIAESCLGKMLDKSKNKGVYQPYLANLNVQWGEFKLGSLQEMRFEEREQERYGIKNGDLIICEGGEPGRCAIWRGELANMKIQKALHRLRVHSDYCSDFLYYRMLLAGKNKELDRHFIGSTIKHLTGIGLKGVEFEFPRFNEQKKLSRVLRSLDEKIELNNKINTELEAMAKLIYDYWFVQFDFPDANGKPYKSSGGKMVYNETLKREIPESWEARPISDLLDIKTGKKDANHATSNGRYHFFTCGDKALRCDDYEFEGKSVLLAGNGNFNVKKYDGRFNAYQRTYVLIPENKNFYELVFYSVQDKVKQLTKGSRGSIVKFITKGDVEDIHIPMPKNNNDYFYGVFNTAFEKIYVIHRENQKLTELRDWLLPMLMNGQVTVKDP